MNDQPTRESNASLRTTFATPVIECLLPNADTLNAELKRASLNAKKATKEPSTVISAAGSQAGI